MKQSILTFTDSQLEEYGLTRQELLDVAQYMSRAAADCDNATELAEKCAFFFEHDEWLDEETHPVWEVAIYYKPAE